jgi:ribonucleoside-diphosphate reductase alpha chain
MDCDTTGIEPAPLLVADKSLVGGGTMRLELQCVKQALANLGCSDIASVPADKLDVFATAFGENSLSPEAHIRMVAACQPFISGGISKTINLPSAATVGDIEQAFLLAWKLGLKSVSVYRDGCKGSQPLNAPQHPFPPTSTTLPPHPFPPTSGWNGDRPYRRKLPDERASLTHKFDIAGHEGYITVGLYPDNTPGEVFVTMSKQGSTIAGLVDAWAIGVSTSLQYGVSVRAIVDKFKFIRFEPSGFTKCEAVPFAHSVVDYVVRWMEYKFLPRQEQLQQLAAVGNEAIADLHPDFDTMPCKSCGSLMVRQGTCYVCQLCGSQEGSC